MILCYIPDPPNAGNDVCNRHHSLLVGIQNDTASLEESLALSHKIILTLTIQSAVFLTVEGLRRDEQAEYKGF